MFLSKLNGDVSSGEDLKLKRRRNLARKEKKMQQVKGDMESRKMFLLVLISFLLKKLENT